MMSIRSLCIYALSLSQLVLVQGRPDALVEEVLDAAEAPQQFREALNAVPAESLHTAVQSILSPNALAGVYQDEHTAVERLHALNPSLASRLLAAAKLEFLKVKRQNDNSTSPPAASSSPTSTPTTSSEAPPTSLSPSPSSSPSPSTPPPTSTSPANNGGGGAPSSPRSSSPAQSTPEDVSTPGVIVPVTTTRTPNGGGSPTVVTTNAVIPSASRSIVIPVTSTNANGDTVVGSTTVPAAVVQMTNSLGQTVMTTSPVSSYRPSSDKGIDITTTGSDGATVILSDVTPGEVISTTDARGRPFKTTYTPATKIVLFTRTLGDGTVETLTSYVVAGGETVSKTGQAASSTDKPKLQSGAEPLTLGGWPLLAAMCAGAFGAALLL